MTSDLQRRQSWYIRRKRLQFLIWRSLTVPLDLWAINTNKYTSSSVAKGFVDVLLLFKLIFIGVRYLEQNRSKRNTLQSQETAGLCQCSTALSWGGSGLFPYLRHPADPEGSCISKTTRTALGAPDIKQTKKTQQTNQPRKSKPTHIPNKRIKLLIIIWTAIIHHLNSLNAVTAYSFFCNLVQANPEAIFGVNSRAGLWDSRIFWELRQKVKEQLSHSKTPKSFDTITAAHHAKTKHAKLNRLLIQLLWFQWH